MARDVILAETPLGFAYDPTYGWTCGTDPTIFLAPLEVGKTYTVVWGNETYTVTAYTATVEPFGELVAIGNGEPFGYQPEDVPFIIGMNEYIAVFGAFLDDAQTRTVGIYGVGTGIVLKDRDGNPVTHYPTGGIRLPMSDGSTSLFVNADDVPKSVSVTINPDFTGDKDMTVVPETGTQFSEVIVKKPELLIPKNIAKGITIAGILGELAGGAELKIASGVYRPPAFMTQATTIAHNLGVIPNIIIVSATFITSSTTAYLQRAVGFRIPGVQNQIFGYTMGSVQSFNRSYTSITAEADNPIAYANETSFRMGSTGYPLAPLSSSAPTGQGYSWYAIGGLD